MLTCGPDHLEVGRADDWHEALTDGVDRPSLTAHQPRDRHSLDERPALDPGFEDVRDAGVETLEEGLEAAEHSRLDDGVRGQRLNPADRVRSLSGSGAAVAHTPAHIPQLALDAGSRPGYGRWEILISLEVRL